jgi:hypothetical protein
MPKLASLILSLVLAATLHVDWHLARPLHHRLSLAWPYHWLATAAVFGVAGWMIARTWPEWRWRLGALVFIGAAIIAQGVEPFLEVLIYDGRLGYHVEAARWAAFGRAIAAAMPAYWGALLLCARPGSQLRAS